jgi:hypothetical protein
MLPPVVLREASAQEVAPTYCVAAKVHAVHVLGPGACFRFWLKAGLFDGLRKLYLRKEESQRHTVAHIAALKQ